MLPTLISLGGITISSFGLFLALALVFSLFTAWRLAKVYDLNEDQLTNLAVLVFLGSIIGARLLAVLLNLSFFNSLEKIVFLNRFPALSFWGGLFGGSFTYWVYSFNKKYNFWLVADIASVAALIGIVLGDFGCFLGGCGYGIESNLPIAAKVVGVVGNRFPVSLVEALLLFLLFNSLWKKVVRYHFEGKIVALFFIWLGLFKIVLENFRGDNLVLHPTFFTLGQLGSVFSFIIGLFVFYRQSKRSLLYDLNLLILSVVSSKKRDAFINKVQKSWYNQYISFRVKLARTGRNTLKLNKFFKRRLNVKSTPDNLS